VVAASIGSCSRALHKLGVGVSFQSSKVRWPSANQRTFLAVEKIAVFTLGSAVGMRAVGCHQHHSGYQFPFVVVLVYDTTKRSGVVPDI